MSAATPRPRRRLRLRDPKLWLGLLITGVTVWLAVRGVSFEELARDLRRARRQPRELGQAVSDARDVLLLVVDGAQALPEVGAIGLGLGEALADVEGILEGLAGAVALTEGVT